jgi:hypothetical protein
MRDSHEYIFAKYSAFFPSVIEELIIITSSQNTCDIFSQI